jgi:hypothetical protein
MPIWNPGRSYMYKECSLSEAWRQKRPSSDIWRVSWLPMGGSKAKYGLFCVRLLLPGYQWSPVIGGSGSIGILNANCAMLFLIMLAVLWYCVILEANHYSKLLSNCSYPLRYHTIPYHIPLAHRIPNCSFSDSKLAPGKEQDASKWEPGLWSELKTF